MPENHNENVPLKTNGVAEEEAMETVTVKPRHRWTKYQKLHLAVTLILFVVCLVLIGFYVFELTSLKNNKNKSSQKGKAQKPESTGTKKNASRFKVCETPECIKLAGQILMNADRSVSPCNDFYRHACGGWLKKAFIPPDKPFWDMFASLIDSNTKLLKNEFDDEKPDKKSTAEVELYKLYKSCMNKTQLKAMDLNPMKKLIQRMGSWSPVNNSWDEKSWDLTDTLSKIHAVFSPVAYRWGTTPLFDVRVVVDITDSEKPIIKIGQSSIDLFPKDQGEATYLRTMIRILKMIGADNADKVAKQIFALEQALDKAQVPAGVYQKIVDSRSKMTIKQLIEATNVPNNKIDWLRYIKLAFKDTGLKFTNSTEVAVHPLIYLKNMTKVISKINKTTIANYFIWSMVKEMKDLLPKIPTDIFLEAKQALALAAEQSPRWQTCISNAQDNMGMALSVMLIKELIQNSDQKQVGTMMDNIKNSFLAIVQDTDWMDKETKKHALNKAKEMIGNIAYPSFIKDPKKLADYYKGVSLKADTFFDNVVQLHSIRRAKNYMKLKSKVDRQDWEFPPSMVNAFYDAGRNKMALFAGILQSPFFNRVAPMPINYGAIGMVIGHELSHGFDDQGRLFDAKGNLRSWWTNKSANAYKARETCIKDQYSGYSLNGVKLNGDQTLGENIADNSGLKTAFRAYKKWVNENGPPQRLPGVNMTDDQLFFLASAQIWCSAEKKGPLGGYGVHSPSMFRVRGTVSNSEDFAKAFNCPKNSPMNPQKKCIVW